MTRAGTLAIAGLAAAVLAASGCNREERLAEQAAAQATAAEDAAKQAEAAFDAAVAEGNWPLAKAQGDVLLARHPGTKAAARVQPRMAEITTKADAEREQRRTAGLWSYQQHKVEGGMQTSAAIYARDEVDIDGSGPQPVRLVLRDHPDWGRSTYLVLERGDFDCYGGCRARVAVDDGAPKSMAALRPETDDAIAMFINDDRALWRLLDGAKSITVEFPVKPSGTRKATFEVSGLDRSQMPW